MGFEIFNGLVTLVAMKIMEHPLAFGAIILVSSVGAAIACCGNGVEIIDVGTQTTPVIVIPNSFIITH